LDQAVYHYFTSALTASTHKTYKAADRRYSQFCKDFSITSFPVSESTLCYFATCMAQQGLTHNTIKTYLSGVRQMQVALGLGDPELSHMPRLRQILKGISVESDKHGKAARARLPIAPAILRKMKAVWFQSRKPHKSIMLWAASATNFFSFCRSVEITTPSENGYIAESHLHLRIFELIILFTQDHYPYVSNIPKQIKGTRELLLLLEELTMTCVQSQHSWTI